MGELGRFVALENVTVETTVLVHQGETAQINLHVAFAIFRLDFGVESLRKVLFCQVDKIIQFTRGLTLYM